MRRVVMWWTILYGIGAAVLEVSFSRHGPSGATPADQAIKDVIYALVWAPVLLGAIALTEWRPVRPPIRRRANLPRLVLHGAALLAAPIVWGTAAYFLRRWAIPSWHPPAGVALMWANTAGGILYVYGSVVIVCHLLLELQEAQRRDAARIRVAEGAADAQLQVLLLELHPHFLGNALQAVSDLLRTAPERAVGALAALRELLASALRAVHEQQVTLAQELRTLRCYLSLQTLRYGARLRVVWDIPAEARAARVPAFILQPLVENAIKHSLDVVREPLEVTIRARRDGSWLELSVVDTGVGLAESTRAGPDAAMPGAPRRDTRTRGAMVDGTTSRSTRPRGGRGLRNVQDRLHHLYGTLGTVRLEGRADRRGTIALVRVPWADRAEQDSGATAVADAPHEVASTEAASPKRHGPARDTVEARRHAIKEPTREVGSTPLTEAADARWAGVAARRDGTSPPTTTPLVRRAATWRVLIGWHAVYAAVVWLIDAFLVPRLPGRSPGAYASLYRVVQVVLWMGTVALGLAVAERWPVRSRRDGRRVLAQVGLWLACAVAWGAAAYVLARLFGLWWSGRPLGTVIGVEAKGVFLAYAIMASLMHLLVNLRAVRARDLAWRVSRQQLAEARVRLLALNLQSAGVLETLDDMTARAATDPRGTDDGVVMLADVLNGYLDLAGEDTATAEELADLADAQARLVNWRTGASVRVAWSGPRTSTLRIPHALIWPLIEDALRRARDGDVVVHVAVEWSDSAPGELARANVSRGRLLRIVVGVRHPSGEPDAGACDATRTAIRDRARELLGDHEAIRRLSWTAEAAPFSEATTAGLLDVLTMPLSGRTDEGSSTSPERPAHGWLAT